MRYRVVFVPEADGKWSVTAPQIRGCRSWGRSLTEARRNIVDAIATHAEIAGKSGKTIRARADLEEDIQLPSSARAGLRRAKTARTAMAAAERAAMVATRAAIVALLDEGLSVRDVGELVGISGQRVQQLKLQPSARKR